MQGEGSSSNPFRDNYYCFNNGSGPRSLNLFQLMEAPDPQEDPLGHPSLNQDPGHHFSFVDLLTRERTPSPFPGPSFEGRNYETNTIPYEGSTSSRIHEFSNGPSTFQGASSSGALPGSIDQNAPSTYSPSDPVMLTSGTARYEVEDNVNLQNSSADGRQFFKKRRAPEDASEQMALGGSSSSAQQAENYEQPVGIFEQLGVGAQGDVRGSLNELGMNGMNLNRDNLEQARSSWRNVRSRAYEQQLSMPVNLTAWHLSGLNVQPISQAAFYFPYESFPSSSSVVAPLQTTLATQTVAQGFSSLQNFQSMQLNGANMFGGSYQEMSSMNRAGYMINPPDFMTPVFEWGYLENVQRNMNMTFPGARRMTDAAGIIAAGHQAPSSSTFPQTNWANSHIMENIIVNGSESRGHYHPMHRFHAAANQRGASNIGRGHASSSQARQRGARRGARRPSPRIRLPTAAERRRRFINEVHEALDIFRREGGEHLLVLIALGEQLGIIANEVEQIQLVENRLTEDTIMARLTRETYHPAAIGVEEHRACSICQDEYAEGDLLGKLDCGHDYHFECIKQWLMRKNSCPMCRHRALAI